ASARRSPAGSRARRARLTTAHEEGERGPHGDRDLGVAERVLREAADEEADESGPRSGRDLPGGEVRGVAHRPPSEPERGRVEEAEGSEPGQAGLGRDLQEVVV